MKFEFKSHRGMPNFVPTICDGLYTSNGFQRIGNRQNPDLGGVVLEFTRPNAKSIRNKAVRFFKDHIDHVSWESKIGSFR